MASGRFPRNNYRNNYRNNNKRNNNGNNKFFIDCRFCSQKIRVLNDDIKYSLDLHNMQSHKGNNDRDMDMDERLSQTSASSGRSRNTNIRQNYVKSNPETNPEEMNVLDSTFEKIPPGLRAHRGFVYESDPGEFACALCNVKIDSLHKIADHLKTKSHEDNTISFIKSKLPSELHDAMEFVSFYGSNLCCNLCGCKINLSSLNPSKTIMNILAHNASRPHVNKKGSDLSPDLPKEGMKKLNFLASLHGLISSNKHMITCEMQPQYKCRICDKLITFDQNDKKLLENFVSHFSSNAHNKCARASSVLDTFKSTNQLKGGKHNLVVSKGAISCTVCNICMEPSLETLDAHVNVVDNFTNIDWPDDLSARIGQMNFNNPQTFKTKAQNNDNRNKLSKLEVLLKTMPPQFRNVNYVVESSPGQVTCLICNCVVPATHYNLKTHLTGGNHSKNENPIVGNNETNRPSISQTSPSETSAKSNSFNPFMKENSSEATDTKNEENGMDKILDYLKKGNPLIKRNLTLLAKHKDNVYSCKLCKMTIPKSNDVDIFKHNVLTHLASPTHTKNYDEKVDSEIKKMLNFDPLVRANKTYLCQIGEHLICNLCDSQLTISIDGNKMKKNLIEHLKGQKHVTKVAETTSNETPKPNKFSESLIESAKVQYNSNKVDDFVKIPPNDSSNMFKIDPVEQFKGPHSSNKSSEPTNRTQKLASMFQNPPEQLKDQAAKFKPKENVFQQINIPASNTNPFLIDPIREQFQKLPAGFQSDVAFIEKSTAVDGFLSCTLCKNNHINPPNLQKHLEEENHKRKKVSLRPPSVQGDFQQATSSNKMMQNMKNFFGLSK